MSNRKLYHSYALFGQAARKIPRTLLFLAILGPIVWASPNAHASTKQETLDRLQDAADATFEALDKTNEAVDALEENPPNTSDALDRLDEALDALGTAIAKLEEVLNDLPPLTAEELAALLDKIGEGLTSIGHGRDTIETVLGACGGGRGICSAESLAPVPPHLNDAQNAIDDARTIVLESVPTVSEWGMIVMVLLALTAGTVVFTRWRRPAAA